MNANAQAATAAYLANMTDARLCNLQETFTEFQAIRRESLADALRADRAGLDREHIEGIVDALTDNETRLHLLAVEITDRASRRAKLPWLFAERLPAGFPTDLEDVMEAIENHIDCTACENGRDGRPCGSFRTLIAQRDALNSADDA